MQKFLGYLLAFVGLAMIVLAVLAWIGIVRPTPKAVAEEGQGPSIWEVLLELLNKAGWVAFVGLILIYFGLKAIGVKLPPT